MLICPIRPTMETCTNLFEKLPSIAIGKKILAELDNTTLGKCRLVCHSWNNFVNDHDIVWDRLMSMTSPKMKSEASPLFFAAYYGQSEIFKKLSQKEEITKCYFKFAFNLSPLHVAAQKVLAHL